ncbi:MAG: cation:proton antiporter [Candidatus Omnitrophota bacterium]
MKLRKNKSFKRWLLGLLILIGLAAYVLMRPPTLLFWSDMPYAGFLSRSFYVLLISFALALFRIALGPTGADRIVAIDIMGIMIVGLCCIFTIVTKRSWYIDIAIAWALQSFISTLALSKYLEGKGFEE